MGPEPKRIGHLTDDTALAELASANASPLMLFALASRLLAASRPGCFGEVDDFPAAEARFSELKAQLESYVGPGDAVERAIGWDDVYAEGEKLFFRKWLSVQWTDRDTGRRIIDAEIARQRAAKAA